MNRKAVKEELAEERPAKRPRVGAPKKDDVDITAVATFDDLNTDVLVNMLAFLTRDEMDNASVLSRRLAEARNHPSFDQTRTATIVCKSETLLGFYEAIASKGWATDIFPVNSNKKHLNVENLESIQKPSLDLYLMRLRDGPVPAPPHLQSVTTLDFSSSSVRNQPHLSNDNIVNVAHILPNVEEVDLSNVRSPGLDFRELNGACPKLERLKWTANNDLCLPLNNVRFTELYMDDCRVVDFRTQVVNNSYVEEDVTVTLRYMMFLHFPQLERLSMKNATHDWCLEQQDPFPQETLIEIVRLHPTLRWFRSDLTDENIAMLKRERPEVTLLNE